MSLIAPSIDPRTATEITDALVALLQQLTRHPAEPAQHYPFTAWRELDPVTGRPTGVSAALVGVFARLAEIAIERLNQAPQKNLLAFLDLLGAARLPPSPARVPVTFLLATGSVVDAKVPAGTQVAAPGDAGPIVFETERPLNVVAAQLATLVALDPEQDAFADRTADLSVPEVAGFPVFTADHAVEHVLYVGESRLLGYPGQTHVTVTVSLAPLPLVTGQPDARQLQWERWTGTDWQAIAPVSDTTSALSIRGAAGVIDLGPLPVVPPSDVNGQTSRWLRCRLRTPITQSTAARAGMLRVDHLPRIQALTLGSASTLTRLLPAAALTNQIAVDLTKDFFPFGEKPRFGDVFLFAISGLVPEAGTQVTIHVTLTNPSDSSNPPIPKVGASADLKLRWELWDGAAWQELGSSTTAGPVMPAANGYTDETNAFTKSGKVTFTLPVRNQPQVQGGVSGNWLRVRIAAGNYGVEAHYVRLNPPPAAPASPFDFILATFAPPAIASLTADYTYNSGQVVPEAMLQFNNLVFGSATGTFLPFQPLDTPAPSLLLGFTLPPARKVFPNTAISLFIRTAEIRYGDRTSPLMPETSTQSGDAGTMVVHSLTLSNATSQAQSFDVALLGQADAWTSVASSDVVDIAPGATVPLAVQVTIPPDRVAGDSDRAFLRLTEGTSGVTYVATLVTWVAPIPAFGPPMLAWQYWNGTRFAPLTVRDDSASFTHPGFVEFLAPADFAKAVRYPGERYWLRVERGDGDPAVVQRIRQVLLNTMSATQTLTIVNEVLGSSIGSGQQTFHSKRVPVLAGQMLEVREPELPSAEEQQILTREEGPNAIRTVDVAGRPREIWVRWHEVPDFYGSAAGDRHYVVNHLTGEIRFGDGINGKIPPAGAGNLRLARYQTGGGSGGNTGAGTVIQLKTTVPYVDKVTNLEGATGGTEAETVDALCDRMPRTLRHRERSVTLEDYEDLAHEASPGVARAACVPLRDLSIDPLGAIVRPGMVSVIIVPRTTDAKPQPTQQLLTDVQDFLAARAPAGVTPAVVGPLYVRVDVTADVAVTSLDLAATVESDVQDRLRKFLHPLTGGLDGNGWDLGRAPHRSDFMALLEDVPGVDHVRQLEIEQTEDLAGAAATGRFLVNSGTHLISLTFEDT